MMNEDDNGFGPSRSYPILGHEETDISYRDFDPTPDICASTPTGRFVLITVM